MSMKRTGSVAGAALAVLAFFGASADAAPLASRIGFSTSGQVGTEGVVGPDAIGFNSVASDAIDAPGLMTLGSFQLATQPAGSTTTYVNTPFSVTFLVDSIDGQPPAINQTPIVLAGTLNGTISGPKGGVFAAFEPIPPVLYRVGPYSTYLSPIAGLYLSADTAPDGRATILGQYTLANDPNPAPIPEPASILAFAVLAAGGLALRRRARPAA
jgi:hypothetical protein